MDVVMFVEMLYCWWGWADAVRSHECESIVRFSNVRGSSAHSITSEHLHYTKNSMRLRCNKGTY